MKVISQKKALIIFLIVFITALFLGIIIGQNFVSQSMIPGLRFLSVPKTADPNLDYGLLWRVWSLIKDEYIKGPVNDQDLFYGALKGSVAELGDRYSVFLKPDLAKEFLEDMSGSFEGIGIEIGIKNDKLTVIAPLPDTPAWRAGLRSGDEIYKVDDQDTLNLSLDEVVHLIRGPKGTPVVLIIWRPGEEMTREVKMTRDIIDIKTVSWELKGNKIAYVNVSHFNEDTWGDFQAIVKVVLRADPNGLILDLRNNPGGYLDTAVNMAGYWVGREIVTVSKDIKGKEIKYQSRGNGEFGNLPTIVLVNQGSASASEILAGALQDYKKATVLGEKTFGKGSVQELESFPDGSALKLTVAYWYTPLGRTINETGIIPDVEVKMTLEDYELGRDPQLSQALDVLGGAPEISQK